MTDRIVVPGGGTAGAVLANKLGDHLTSQLDAPDERDAATEV